MINVRSDKSVESRLKKDPETILAQAGLVSRFTTEREQRIVYQMWMKPKKYEFQLITPLRR